MIDVKYRNKLFDFIDSLGELTEKATADSLKDDKGEVAHAMAVRLATEHTAIIDVFDLMRAMKIKPNDDVNSEETILVESVMWRLVKSRLAHVGLAYVLKKYYNMTRGAIDEEDRTDNV